jgi:hypothetical protein
MKNYGLTFLLALAVVLTSASLRQSVAAVGGSPVPMPPTVAAVGGSPVPMPPTTSVGGSPVPMPPTVAPSEADR